MARPSGLAVFLVQRTRVFPDFVNIQVGHVLPGKSMHSTIILSVGHAIRAMNIDRSRICLNRSEGQTLLDLWRLTPMERLKGKGSVPPLTKKYQIPSSELDSGSM